MKGDHVLDELSAYLDGEARDPERITRHLQQCPACARRHIELSKVSSHVKALSPPEVNPAFATRVLAAIARTRPVPRIGLVRWSVVSSAAVAIVLLLTAIAVLHHRQPVEPLRIGTVDNAISGYPDSEGAILVKLERHIAAGREIALLEMAAAMKPVDDLEVPTSVMLDMLADASWFPKLAGQLEAEEDLGTLIQSLDDAETEVLKQLLDEYAKEVWRI